MAVGLVNSTQQYINSAQECTLSGESLKCVQQKKEEEGKCKTQTLKEMPDPNTT